MQKADTVDGSESKKRSSSINISQYIRGREKIQAVSLLRTDKKRAHPNSFGSNGAFGALFTVNTIFYIETHCSEKIDLHGEFLYDPAPLQHRTVALLMALQNALEIIDVLRNVLLVEIFINIPTPSEVMMHQSRNTPEVIVQPLLRDFLVENPGLTQKLELRVEPGNMGFSELLVEVEKLLEIDPVCYLRDEVC